MFTSELDVINACLATLGQTPVNQIDEDNPFIASAKKKLEEANLRVQSRKWWFNFEIIKLLPDTNSKFIYTPGDTISCRPIGFNGRMTAIVQRDRRLFDTRHQTYEFKESVTCELVRLIPFKNLPPVAQILVKADTVRQFQRDFDADMNKVRLLENDYMDAFRQANIENTRNASVNNLYNEYIGSAMYDALGQMIGGPSTGTRG